MKKTRKIVVVSAVNIAQGGILSILKDCLFSFSKVEKKDDLKLVVFVHKKELVADYIDMFEIVEYPDIKASWSKRLIFEYITSNRLSKKFKPFLWISLHDISPRVSCSQVVYCHNPSPFYKTKFKDVFYDKTFFLFSLFYRYLYGINIRSNRYVIVQQNWMRNVFEKMYKVKTIVAHPFVEHHNAEFKEKDVPDIFRNKYIFFYPSFPRVFKNFEIIFKAIEYLSNSGLNFEVWVTINGTENKYSNKLYREFSYLKQIKFMGELSRDNVFDVYQQVNCLLFSSKLETWGLPISEFKETNKLMLLSDCLYAHEALGEYENVAFFNPDNYLELASLMKAAVLNGVELQGNKAVLPEAPFCRNWDDLLEFLLLNV